MNTLYSMLSLIGDDLLRLLIRMHQLSNLNHNGLVDW